MQLLDAAVGYDFLTSKAGASLQEHVKPNSDSQSSLV
jgi:hypothetical protein